MAEPSDSMTAFEAEVIGRFDILLNFFRSAIPVPELIQDVWSFAKAGYLDKPIPTLFKGRLFVTFRDLGRPVLPSLLRHASGRRRRNSTRLRSCVIHFGPTS
jgi:hypothetical protein